MTASRSGAGETPPGQSAGVPALRPSGLFHLSQLDVMCCIAA
jgi:hypothetical protein